MFPHPENITALYSIIPIASDTFKNSGPILKGMCPYIDFCFSDRYYFTFKKNGIQNIMVDNIRESKLRSLAKEKKQSEAQLLLKRNIIPKLELYQMAFVEFL